MAPTAAPGLRLGITGEDGIAPTIFALLDRGLRRRPEVAREMRGLVELRWDEDITPVRLAFEADEVVVEDGSWEMPDLVIAGRLPHIVHLTTTPMLAGVPNPARAHGRAVLGAPAPPRDVRIEGDRALGRKLLRLRALDRRHERGVPLSMLSFDAVVRALALAAQARRQLDEQAHAEAAAGLAGVGAPDVPGGARDVDVRPGDVAGEALQELGRRDRGRLARLRARW